MPRSKRLLMCLISLWIRIRIRTRSPLRGPRTEHCPQQKNNYLYKKQVTRAHRIGGTKACTKIFNQRRVLTRLLFTTNGKTAQSSSIYIQI